MLLPFILIGYVFMAVFVMPFLLYIWQCLDLDALSNWHIKLDKKTFQEAVNEDESQGYLLVCILWLPAIISFIIVYSLYGIYILFQKCVFTPYCNFMEKTVSKFNDIHIEFRKDEEL